MANEKTILDEWSVRDLEDGSSVKATVVTCTELGNQSKPIQVLYMGNIINYEPLMVERWAYQASKAGVDAYLLDDKSWMVYPSGSVRQNLSRDRFAPESQSGR